VIGVPIARVSITTVSQLIASSGDIAVLAPVWDTTDFAINNMIATTSGITVPLQGYYIVNAGASFFSDSAYTNPISGSIGYISIFDNDENELSRGIALGYTDDTSTASYTSSLTDILYFSQNEIVNAYITGGAPTGAIYVGAADELTYFSLTYICS
jgi:hypothetical protein